MTVNNVGPSGQGMPAGALSKKSKSTPYIVIIGLLAVVLIGVLAWALWPTGGGTAAPSEEPSQSTTSPDSSESQPSDQPSDEDPSPMPTTGITGYDLLRQILPERIEQWKLEELEGADGLQPVYKDGKRRISFVPLGQGDDPKDLGAGKPELQTFDDGACYVNPKSTSKRMITCAIAPKAANGEVFLMSSRYADIEEMVNISQTVIAHQ